MTKKSVFNLLRIAISLGFILLLFWIMRDSLGEVFLTIKKMNKLFLFISFLFLIFGIWLLSVRLKFIMTAQHLKITQKEVTFLTFIGHFFNNFLPTSIGGDLVKAYYASKTTGKNLSSIACIVFDRILGTMTLVLMVLATYFFVKEATYNKTIIVFLVISVLVSLAVTLVLFSRRIAKRIPLLSALFRIFNLEERMKGVYEIIYNYKNHPGLIFNAVVISFGLQISMFYAVYLTTKGLNFSIPLKTVFLLMPIISTVSMAPSINGLGVRESSFVFFFSPMMGKEGAFALSILWLGLNFSVSLIGGVLYLFGKQYRIKGGVGLNDR